MRFSNKMEKEVNNITESLKQEKNYEEKKCNKNNKLFIGDGACVVRICF